ncbi:MAG: GAF domain-containing protein [Terriglobales bacterium]
MESKRNLYPPIKNDRRTVRQKVHLPAHVGMKGDLAGKGFEVIEVLDLSEDGACIQTSVPLAPDSILTLSLDLMETGAFVSTACAVVWSDQRGRNGIHFRDISEASRQQLRQWLAAHSAVSGANSPQTAVRDEYGPRPVRTRRESGKREFVKQSPEQTRAALAASKGEPEVFLPADYSSVLSALVTLKREVEATGSDLDKALQLLASRALSLTHATGAAIALARGSVAGEMICRARAGSDAPGLGARLQVGSGFSGECVRSGKVLRCDDAEVDARVDRQGCRALGIRSIIAAPVRRDDSIVGIMEVFSPDSGSFGPGEEKTLERIAQMIAGCLERNGAAQIPAAVSAPAVAAEAPQTEQTAAQFKIPTQIERLLEPTSSPLRKWWVAAVGIGLVAILFWIIVDGTAVRNFFKSGAQPSAHEISGKTGGAPAVAQSSDLESLQKLAADGDPNAQFDLGARYATGEGVVQDYSQSVRWFTLAAEQGHVIAQATLGAYYWAGRGIPQDLSKAYFWSAIAEAGGDAASKYRVEVLAARMSHSQVVAAQKQADEWLKKHRVGK